MTARAEGTFTVASWSEDTYSELDGKGKLTKATVGYRLNGGIEGDATWEAVMFYRADGTASGAWRVIPGSGTGGLTGLSGSGTSVATSTPPGTFTFDYELD